MIANLDKMTYNILMRPAFLSLLIAGLLLPVPSLAYMTPEDVLLQQLNFYGSTNYTPPNTRQARENAAALEAAREEQHPVSTTQPPEQSSSSSSVSSSEVLHEAATTAEPAEENIDDMSEEEMLQLLWELEAEEGLHANATAQQQQNPLAPTGMGTAAALSILAAGIVVTLWRARKMRR